MLREVIHRVEKVYTLLPVSEVFLADLAPEALEDLQGLGFWVVTDELHKLWQALKSGVEATVVSLPELEGKRIASIHLAEMRMASPYMLLTSEGWAHYADRPVLLIWTRVEVGEDRE